MSQENVEIVREIWRAFERFEFPAEAFADDALWHTATDLPDRETCAGPVAIQQMLAEGWGAVVDPGWGQGTGQRDTHRLARGAHLRRSGRKGRRGSRVSDLGRSPRSRRAAGVRRSR